MSLKNEVDLCLSASINFLEDWLECTISLSLLENRRVERCHISSPALESHNENQGCCAISRTTKKKTLNAVQVKRQLRPFVYVSVNADQIQGNHKTQSSQALTGCSVNTMWMWVNRNLKLPYLNTQIPLHKGETLFHQLVL